MLLAERPAALSPTASPVSELMPYPLTGAGNYLSGQPRERISLQLESKATYISLCEIVEAASTYEGVYPTGKFIRFLFY